MIGRSMFLVILLNFNLSSAQSLETLDLTSMTDSEVVDLISSAKKKGYSEEEIVRMAKLRGISEAKILEIRNRIATLDLNSREEAALFERVREENVGASGPTVRSSRSVMAGTSGGGTTSQKVYGSYLFENPTLTFSPNQNIPTPSNYILGPGDEIIIDIWGASEMNYMQTLSNEGTIRISGIGPIFINGLTIDQAKSKVINRLTKIYAGLLETDLRPRNTYADLTLGKLRNLKVNVIGEAKVPGTYTVSSLTTAFNALYAANGPNKRGSMRMIDIYRSGQKVATLDIYKFLFDGDESANVRLSDQDMIYIRPYRNRVKIEGQVRRPGLYELVDDESMEDLLTYSGGFNAKAYKSKIGVVRFTDSEKEILSVAENEYENFKLRNGDELTVGKVLDKYANRLRISGAVFRPGAYPFKPGMTIKDLLEEADGITGDAYLDRGIIVRRQPDMKLRYVHFNLGKIIREEEWLPVMEEDSVVIASALEMQRKESVSVLGEVPMAGKIPYRFGLRLGDVIVMARGFNETANGGHVEVSRAVNTDSLDNKFTRSVVRRFPIENLELSENNKEFPIESGDMIKVNKSPGFERISSVSIRGEVLYEGKYAIQRQNERISNIIERATLKETAFLDGAYLIRRSTSDESNSSKSQATNLELLSQRHPELLGEQGGSYLLIPLNLTEAVGNPGSTQDLIARSGDLIIVPEFQEVISLKGEVFHPNTIPYDPKWQFGDYVDYAGGFTKSARRAKTYIVNFNGSAQRTKKFLGMKKYPQVKPGGIIVVPSKGEKSKPNFRDLLGITTSALSIIFIIARL